jgi:hypothetical protein
VVLPFSQMASLPTSVSSALIHSLKYAGYANNVIGVVVALLKRKYGLDNVTAHGFSSILNSLAFAGTTVGHVFFCQCTSPCLVG